MSREVRTALLAASVPLLAALAALGTSYSRLLDAEAELRHETAEAARQEREKFQAWDSYRQFIEQQMRKGCE